MPSLDQWRDYSNLELIRDNAKKSRLVRIHRPALIHARNKVKGRECPCCTSKNAHVSRKVPHIDMLLDTWTGERYFRTKKNSDLFDEVANGPGVEQIYMPLRCSEQQWKFVVDLRYCMRRGELRKVVAMFAGNRAGKTATMKEIAIDCMLVFGGPGTKFWFVAPTTKMCMIDVGKLFVGEHDAVKLPPLIPPRLIRDYPKSEQQLTYKPGTLIDGTQLLFLHAHGNGDNLKGKHATMIFATELCAVRDKGNWHVMVNRTMGTEGCLFVDSTPMAGHWAKEEIHDIATSLAKAEPDSLHISDRVSCFNNPWYSEKQVKATIETLGDPRLIDREVHGKWVPMGNVLWHYWNAERMASKGWRTCEDLGFVNITEQVMRKFFKGHPKQINSFGGLDYNVYPMSLVELQIGCKPGHENSPKHWHLFALGEVVVSGGTQALCAALKDGTAAAGLGYPPDYFHGFPIAADSTGSLDRVPSGHGVNSNVASSLAKYMQLEGFDVRPCNRSLERHRPENPKQIDSLNLMHTIMHEGRYHVQREYNKKLIHGHEAQEAEFDGRIKKESGKPSDKLSSQTDACRYGAWAALSRHEPGYREKVKWRKK